MDKETGGAAFPGKYQYRDSFHTLTDDYVSGMTLRDYFAARAMSIGLEGWSDEDVAIEAYRVADAMIAERAKEQ